LKKKSLLKINDDFWIEQTSSSTRVPPLSSPSSEQLSLKKTSPIPQQYLLCHACQKPIIGQVFIFLNLRLFIISINIHF